MVKRIEINEKVRKLNKSLIYQVGYQKAIAEVEKMIDECKCYCELCAFGLKHNKTNNKKDKLINVEELKSKLSEMKK